MNHAESLYFMPKAASRSPEKETPKPLVNCPPKPLSDEAIRRTLVNLIQRGYDIDTPHSFQSARFQRIVQSLQAPVCNPNKTQPETS